MRAVRVTVLFLGRFQLERDRGHRYGAGGCLAGTLRLGVALYVFL